MSDDVRQEYRKLSDLEQDQIKQFKEIGQRFIDLCHEQGSSREIALAITNAEQAVMWATKHVTR